jgi:D-alanyl-D-alanine carboxypeptidase (penicillin-binding protein 5/6)
LLVVLLRGEQEPVPMWQQAARLLDFGFALPAGTEPVGVLVDRAPPAEASGGAPSMTAEAGTSAVAGPTAPTAESADTAEAAGADAAADGGGHGAIYLVALLLVLAGALSAVLWWRRVRPVRR